MPLECYKTYIVDAEHDPKGEDPIQDGSIEHPFKTVASAMKHLNTPPGAPVTVVNHYSNGSTVTSGYAIRPLELSGRRGTEP